MTKTEIKQVAQDRLMSAMQAAFDQLTTEAGIASNEDVRDAMDKQMARVEKLFGHEVGSWTRGV